MKIIKENGTIKCKKCGKVLGEYVDGWIKIERQNVVYSSNGILHRFLCSRCDTLNEIKIVKK